MMFVNVNLYLLCCMFCILQFIILVIDSTDRERLSITKEELYKMMANDVSINTLYITVD